MKTFHRFLSASLFSLLLISPVLAEEKNGLSVAVTKTTIENNDTRGGGYYSDRINRTQGLKAAIKNVSFKEMPEGEVTWTILVLRYSSTAIESYTGTEKLKSLKPAEATDMIIGKAETGGYRNYGPADKDKTEWQVVVRHGGKEIIKTQSTSAFDSLAKRATKGTTTTK